MPVSSRAAPVVPAVRAGLVVPDDPVELAAQAGLVVPEDPVVLAAPAGLVVPEDPVVQAARVALGVPEDPVVQAARVVPESPAVLVAPEQATDPVVALELQIVRVVVPEQATVPVEALAVPSHQRDQRAVALRTKSVIAVHLHDLVPLLEAGEDLAAAVAETTREPAAAEAAIAWAVVDSVEAVVAVAVVVEVAAEAAEVAAEAAEDAEDKRAINEETNENRSKYYDFAENFSGRFCDPYVLFVKHCGASCATG
jgi:hypothetical protein